SAALSMSSEPPSASEAAARPSAAAPSTQQGVPPTGSDGAARTAGAELGPRGGGAGRTTVLVVQAATSGALLGIGVGFAIAEASDSRSADSERASLASLSGSTAGDSVCKLRPSANTWVSARCAALGAAIDDGQSHHRISTIGFIGAGLGAASFALTWLLWRTP